MTKFLKNWDLQRENILVSMDAIAELYETIMNLTLEIEALKGGVDNGDSNE